MTYRSPSKFRKQYQLRVSSELEHFCLIALRDVLLLAFELFIENAMGQVISTVEHPRIPLRDLGCEFFTWLNMRTIAYYGYKFTVEQIALFWIVICLLHGGRGLTLLHKGARCLLIARSLRMCLYTMTVLPSPKEWCRFEEPVNAFKLRVGGACNDLLYSGHVTVYTVSGIAMTILAQQYSFILIRLGVPFIVWLHIIQKIICTILELHHYSIDMFLGLIVTLLMWHCPPLHISSPRVPDDLFAHLKQLVFPKPLRTILKDV